MSIQKLALKVSFVVVSLAWVAPTQATVYSAVSDFPTVGNATSPLNGVWSYGYATTLSPLNFTPDSTSTGDYFNDGNAAGFYTPTTVNYDLPAILKNVSGGTLDGIVGTIGPWPTSLLLLHPGESGAYAVVRFTAPTSATYNVSGLFTAMGNYSGATVDTVVYGPGSTVLFSTVSTNGPHPFSFSQSLAAGESLNFAVGFGPSGQFYYDSTGFDVTITPEPAFYGFLTLGLGGLALARHAFRKQNG